MRAKVFTTTSCWRARRADSAPSYNGENPIVGKLDAAGVVRIWPEPLEIDCRIGCFTARRDSAIQWEQHVIAHDKFGSLGWFGGEIPEKLNLAWDSGRLVDRLNDDIADAGRQRYCTLDKAARQDADLQCPRATDHLRVRGRKVHGLRAEGDPPTRLFVRV